MAAVLMYRQEVTAFSQHKERCKRTCVCTLPLPHVSSSSWPLGWALGCERENSCVPAPLREEENLQAGSDLQTPVGFFCATPCCNYMENYMLYKIYIFSLVWFDVGCVGISDHILKEVPATVLNVSIYKSKLDNVLGLALFLKCCFGLLLMLY